MNHETFCEKIGLPKEAIDCIASSPITNTEYAALKQMFFQNISAFQKQTLANSDWKKRYLYLFTRLASEAFDIYQKRGIPEQIFWDTFSDQKIWYKNCVKTYGEPGLAEYDWLWMPLQLRLFKLGRLQFVPQALQKSLEIGQYHLPVGSIVLDTHIPQGEPLESEAVKASFRQAISFFRGVLSVFTCHSWLISPQLHQVLPNSSRILQFQQLFQVVEIDDADRQAEERIFGKVLDNITEYPETTSLQSSAKKYLLSGNKLGTALGVYFYQEA